jgi:hypothetical protein
MSKDNNDFIARFQELTAGKEWIMSEPPIDPLVLLKMIGDMEQAMGRRCAMTASHNTIAKINMAMVRMPYQLTPLEKALDEFFGRQR